MTAAKQKDKTFVHFENLFESERLLSPLKYSADFASSDVRRNENDQNDTTKSTMSILNKKKKSAVMTTSMVQKTMTALMTPSKTPTARLMMSPFPLRSIVKLWDRNKKEADNTKEGIVNTATKMKPSLLPCTTPAMTPNNPKASSFSFLPMPSIMFTSPIVQTWNPRGTPKRHCPTLTQMSPMTRYTNLVLPSLFTGQTTVMTGENQNTNKKTSGGTLTSGGENVGED